MAPAGPVSATTPGVQFQRTCFGCGQDNPHGLQLDFRVAADGVASASWIADSRWEGLMGIVHGGILTTLLDEAMAKAVAATGNKTMTADLRVRFRQSARTGEVLLVRGWIASRRRRLIETEATVRTAGGNECAHAWAVFLALKNPKSATEACGGSPGEPACEHETGE